MDGLLKFARQSAVVIAAALSFTLAAVPAHAGTSYTWMGPGRNWGDAANWMPHGVPGASDQATIGANNSVVLGSVVQINKISVGKGTRLSGAGDLKILGSGTFTDVALLGTGILRVEAGAGLTILTDDYDYGPIPPVEATGPPIGGNVNTEFIRKVYNFGAINWDGGNLLVYNSLTNAANATFRIRGDGALVRDTAVSQIVNEGTIIKTAATETKTNLPFTNNGTITIQGGNLYFYSGFSQKGGKTSLKGGNIYSQNTMSYAGGGFDGIGTIQGSVNNSGARFTPGNSPGAVVINGNYTQTSGGTLQMELGGVTAGTQYDQMTVNGTATLDGTLEIAQFNGFVPAAGSSFQLLKYLVCIGNFSKVNNLFVTPGNSFTTTKTPTFLVAQPVADALAPTCAITAPQNDLGYASVTQATGTASDTGSGLDKVTVKLFRYAGAGVTAGFWNGATWDAAYTAAKNELPATGTSAWTFAMPALSAAKYDLTATARDKAANTTPSTKIIFWIDTTLPNTPTFTAPTNNAVVANINTISGTASDAGSGLRRVDVRIKKNSDGTYWNGSAWTAVSVYLRATLNGETWTLTNNAVTPLPTGASLPNGSYQLTALVADKAELKRSASINVTVQAAPPITAGSALEEPSE